MFGKANYTFAQSVCVTLLVVGSTLCAARPALASNVAIRNGTRTVMISLQIRSPGSPWQGNALRDGPLGVQRQTTIYVRSDGCYYDLKATFEDGHRVMRPRANLCGSAFVIRDF